MCRLISVILILFLYSMAQANARPVDNFGRNLRAHEGRRLGHTIKKHVAKRYTWLRGRCKRDRIIRNKGVASSYRTLSDAEDIIYHLVMDNRNEIQRYLDGSLSSLGVPLVIEDKESWIDRPLGYGRGIDCALLGKTRVIRFGRIPVRLKLDQYSFMSITRG